LGRELAGDARRRPLASVAIACRDRLESVAPLVVVRHAGIARRVLTGVGVLSEPMDLACVDQADRVALVENLVRDGRPLWLERVAADSPTVALLRRAARARGHLIVRPQGSCPYIELSDAWHDPLSQINAGRRSDLRRARRRAEAIGSVETEILTPGLGEVDALLTDAFDIEARSWKGAAGTALAHDARRAPFYRAYARRACAAGQLRLCFLSIAGGRVAMQIAIERGGRFWLLKVGYDERFAACSPGQLLASETIRYAVGKGLTGYEFLGGTETWTQVWTRTSWPTVSVRFYPWSMRGAAALAIDGVTVGWRGLRRRPTAVEHASPSWCRSPRCDPAQYAAWWSRAFARLPIALPAPTSPARRSSEP
jgi:CelD/BcsL family acetyltransferase involved in cellulose biosynthesis